MPPAADDPQNDRVSADLRDSPSAGSFDDTAPSHAGDAAEPAAPGESAHRTVGAAADTACRLTQPPPLDLQDQPLPRSRPTASPKVPIRVPMRRLRRPTWHQLRLHRQAIARTADVAGGGGHRPRSWDRRPQHWDRRCRRSMPRQSLVLAMPQPRRVAPKIRLVLQARDGPSGRHFISGGRCVVGANCRVHPVCNPEQRRTCRRRAPRPRAKGWSPRLGAKPHLARRVPRARCRGAGGEGGQGRVLRVPRRQAKRNRLKPRSSSGGRPADLIAAPAITDRGQLNRTAPEIAKRNVAAPIAGRVTAKPAVPVVASGTTAPRAAADRVVGAKVSAAGDASQHRDGSSKSSMHSNRWSIAALKMFRTRPRKAAAAASTGRSSSERSPIRRAESRCRWPMCCSARAVRPNFRTSAPPVPPPTRPSFILKS